MNIYVSNLASNVTEEDLKELFSEYGHIDSAKVIKDFETGRSRGFGFVEMSQSSGQKAIETLNGTEFNGMPLSVSEAREKRNNNRSDGNYRRDSRSGGRSNRF